VRSYGKVLGENLPKWLTQIAQTTAAAHGAQAEVEYKRYTVALRNDRAMADRIARVAERTPGVTAVDRELRMMAGEDMAFFLKLAPGCYYCIGVGREGAAPLHNSKFDFNEDLMQLGVETHCRIALDLLG